MKRANKLGLLSATILAVGVGAAGAQTPTTPPQTTAEVDAPEEDDAIVVTGSRLRRETFDSPNPTVQVGRQEIEERALTNIGDAIEDIPLVGFGGNSRGTQGQNGDSMLLPDILDLGSQRTLTLLNGRRIQPTLPGTVFVPGNASGSQVDLATINPLIVERIEVVAGTGGAIYGADAVGGVINIITRDNFEGSEVFLQGGVTELGDGEQYRIGGLWGANFLDDRANITLSVDYFNQDVIASSTDRPSRYLGSGITNPLDGSRRDANPFTAASAADTLRAGGTLSPAFGATATDGNPSVFFGPLSLANPLASLNGVLLTRHQLATGFGTTTPVVPAIPVQPGTTGATGTTVVNGITVPFFAPSQLGSFTAANVFAAYSPGLNTAGLSGAQQNSLALQILQRNRPTPYEYLQANPGLNPLLFLGTFGTFTNNTSTTAAGARDTLNGYFPTIANTDPATSALFPRVAVPLAFDAAGNVVDYNPGNYGPGSLGLLGAAFGGQGYDVTAAGANQVQSGQERASFSGFGSYNVTDNITYRAEAMYSDVTFTSVTGPDSQISSGSTQAGTLAVPLFINQNPFLSTAARNTITTRLAGLVLPTFDVDPTAGVNSQPVLYLGRNLTDIIGGPVPTTAQSESFRILQALDGEFAIGERDFYWDAAAYYGRSETHSTTVGVLDIEFALAVDVVQGPSGPVCRQQTLAAPVPITAFNPGVGAIITGVSLTPTAAQVAACQPLNLLGNGASTAAARDYVTSEQTTSSINTLEVYSGSIGGDIFKLPAGWIQIGLNLEQRVEAAEFEPDPVLQRGLTRTALQFVGGGQRQFVEYGYEALIPVFSEEFNIPFFRELELSYAYRFVEREQKTSSFPTNGTPTYDDTFNYSLRWKPHETLTLRGARSRTVRAASLVELFDPGIRAFGQLSAQSHPCATINIDSGPAPATRRANCVAAVQAYGYAASAGAATTFLASFNPTLTPNRPATAAGNPFLANEESNAYTFGFTYEPNFVPRLVLALDFFSVDLSGELGLVGPPTTTNACFDSSSFPDSVVGASNPACDAVLFTLPNGTIPTINPLTGRASVTTAAFGGQAANPSSPFEIAALDFLNLNLAVRELRSLNFEMRYNFGLDEVPFIGDSISNWGEIFLRSTVYHTARYDVFTPTLNRQSEEHTFPEFQTRLDVNHRVGAFSQTLQWFWNSETFTNIQLTTPIVDQSPAFAAEDTDFFNYFASYDVNDDVTVRLIVNNVADTEGPRGVYGVTDDYDGGVGREFIFGVNARF